MAKTLSAEFEFEVGDSVRHKNDERLDPEKLIILERHIQECHGGVQTHYLCHSLFHALGTSGHSHILVASIEVAACPTKDEIQANKLAKEEAEQLEYEESSRRREERRNAKKEANVELPQ